ncbi:MAG: peptidoglycan-binding protein [Candidatus Taylorbacteria bacterium]|nr:peptidoglycan-binding protein [Candidatus Taylorbacteria bacterium]
MKYYKNVFLVSFLVLSLLSIAHIANAAIASTVSLSNITSTDAQLSVFGDANSPVQLYYGPTAGTQVTLGSTDSSGNLKIPIGTDSYNISCGKIAYVVVNGQRSATIPWVPANNSCSSSSSNIYSATSTLVFSQNDIVIPLNKSQSISIVNGNSTTGYSIANNSTPGIVTLSITDKQIYMFGSALGNTNVSICGSGNQCGVLKVTVSNTPVSASSTFGQATVLSSFGVTSDNANNQFMGKGNVLTINFSMNGMTNAVSGYVANTSMYVSGSGAGPYTIKYTVTGSETLPIPVLINFENASSNFTRVAFALGNISVRVASTSTPTEVTKNSYTFSKFLGLNSTGEEVTQLQKRLAELGFYSGPVNGRFGHLTEAGLKALQKAHNLTPAGYVGPGTRTILNK